MSVDRLSCAAFVSTNSKPSQGLKQVACYQFLAIKVVSTLSTGTKDESESL
ncbi:MAG: hypothetical protein HC795_18970 [Coleofasciculaceae cyanobacterium RL_1_1]|nr:hypothetical protein [Coleofasciculaceae cyanobacterium RL_1_1]